MSTTEKLMTIAENVQKVFDAGRNSMVDESKIIEKTVSGNPVVIADASELPHTVTVHATHNKNMIPFPYVDDSVKELNGITWVLNSDRSVTASGMPTGWSHYTLGTIEIEQGETYTITLYSETAMENLCVQCKLENDDGYLYNNFVDFNYQPTKIDTSLYPSATRITLLIGIQYKDRAVSGSNMFVQMEKGATSTPYIPYKAPVSGIQISLTENGATYTTDSDGVIKTSSLSPYMTFTCDEAVDIQVDYWQSYGLYLEYNKFWDALQNKGAGEDYEQRFFNFPGSIFYPKYDFIFSAYYAASATFRKSSITDMIKNCDFTALPASNYGLMYTFLGSLKLVNARTLKVRPDLKYSRIFDDCTKLEEVRFEGEIGQNGLSFASCPKLSIKSLRSILAALSKDTTYASGKTITFDTASQAVIEADTVCIAHLTDAVNAGWTIAYA